MYLRRIIDYFQHRKKTSFRSDFLTFILWEHSRGCAFLILLEYRSWIRTCIFARVLFLHCTFATSGQMKVPPVTQSHKSFMLINMGPVRALRKRQLQNNHSKSAHKWYIWIFIPAYSNSWNWRHSAAFNYFAYINSKLKKSVSTEELIDLCWHFHQIPGVNYCPSPACALSHTHQPQSNNQVFHYYCVWSAFIIYNP